MGDNVAMIERDIQLVDGRMLHVYDTGTSEDGRTPVFWHHGTPNLGQPPEPLFAAADRLGLRWIGFDRPGYGGSSVDAGRTIASGAGDTAQVADALGITRFAVMGYSGGGTYALGCAAALGDRVCAAVTLSAIAPYGASGLDWFAGMLPSGVAVLGTAAAGRSVRFALDRSGFEYDIAFTPDDLALFDGPWGWLGAVAGPALDAGPYGQVDDDVSYMLPWGCEPRAIDVPVLLLHGDQDRIIPASHGRWLANAIGSAERRVSEAASHFTIVREAESALEWLRQRF
jgi:pimeloyl-ACP methyl ester carboxylesterase